MSKLKSGVFFLVALFFANSIIAQSLDAGKENMYFEKFRTAKDVFQKLVTANPNDEEAIYWLGQSEIALDDVAGAKTLYQQKLSTMTNSALLYAGIGHVELIEGKKAEARQHFEMAVSLSKGQSIAVLNAIGYANGNPDSKNGDANYAIEKLKQATQIKKFRDPDVLTNLGDAYRKAGNGGDAIKSYQEALNINPKYARAYYRSGSLYQTQGSGQESLFMDYYNKAIAAQPNYGPVYNALYTYYYQIDVSKSAMYLDKYLANSDNDESTKCYYQASILYAQAKFKEAASKADECIAASGATPNVNLYKIKSFASTRLNDSLNAKSSFEEYFKRQNPDKIEGGDYSAYAALLLKFPGNEARVAELVEKAVTLDSVPANKAAYMKSLAQAYEAQKNPAEAAKWYGRIISVKPNYSNVDLFNAGYNYYAVNQYDSSNKFFKLYTEKYPADILGYYMLGNAAAVVDSTGAQGLAVPYYTKVVELGEADPTKPNAKTRLMNAYKFFYGYYYNAKKDQATALTYVNKAAELDPADQQVAAAKKFISENDPNAPPRRTTTPRTPTTPTTPATPRKPASGR